MSERQKLVVILTSGVNGDRSTVGLTLANAALSNGMDVLVFLVSDAVDLSRVGAADLAHYRPFQPLHDLLESFVQNGGQLVACGSCVQHRGMEAAKSTEGTQISGISVLVKWLAQGAQTVTF